MSDETLKAESGLLRKRLGNPLLGLVVKVNKGDRGTAALGIFPHALKKLVCDKHPEGEELLEGLSRDIVRDCSARFRQYQILSARADSLRLGNNKPNLHQCLDPFHFLEPLKDRTPAIRSTCVCDLVKFKKRKVRVSKGVNKVRRNRKPGNEQQTTAVWTTSTRGPESLLSKREA